MKLFVSGTEQEFREVVTVAAVIGTFATDSRGIAVAVNDQVVHRSAWNARELREGDRVEIVRAVQGG